MEGQPNSHSKGPPKWSEQLLLTRILGGVFLLLLAAVLYSQFTDFIVAKSWADNQWPSVIFASIYALLMVVCLTKDPELLRQATHSWKSKLTVLGFTLLMWMILSEFIGKTLPYVLHQANTQQQVVLDVSFRKSKGWKFCRDKVEILATDTFAKSRLCLASDRHDNLPKQGQLSVSGVQSRFGMTVTQVSI